MRHWKRWPRMRIECFKSDLLSSNMYIIEEDGASVIVDPCRDPEAAKGRAPEWIFLTHEHYDHISGVNVYKERFHIPVVCSKICSRQIMNPRRNMSQYFEAFCKMQDSFDNAVPEDFEADFRCSADVVYDAEQTFEWRGHSMAVIPMPGHSPGGAALLVDGHLFSGDSIFKDRETVLRFPGGSAVDWKNISLPRIRQLPPDTMIYPGHYEPFSLNEWAYYREELN